MTMQESPADLTPAVTPAPITLRDYFAAHAPVTHASWFKPKLTPAPTMPNHKTAPGPIRIELGLWANSEIDPKTPAAIAWVEEFHKAREALDAWELEKTRQFSIQWPFAWADALLEARGE